MGICKNVKKDVLAICILIPILVGGLASLFTRDSMDLYSSIKVPSFAPPGFLFPIVWILLYILMGISCYLIYVSGSDKTSRALVIYAVQLALNFAWSQILYLLWVTFAGVLNLSIYLLNK